MFLPFYDMFRAGLGLVWCKVLFRCGLGLCSKIALKLSLNLI